MPKRTYKNYDYNYSILGLSSLTKPDDDWPSGNPHRKYKLFSDKKKAKQTKVRLEQVGAERVLLTRNESGYLVSWARSKRSEMGKDEYRRHERMAHYLGKVAVKK